MTCPPDRLSDPFLRGPYSNCRNDSIRLLLINKVSETVIFSDYTGLYGRPAVFDDSPFGTVHGNCPARGRTFKPVIVVIMMFGCSPSDDPLWMDHEGV